MHLHTIVKVWATDEKEAALRVNALLTDDGEYRFMTPFDWVAEEETKVSASVKTEDEFRKIRELEREAYHANVARAFEADCENMRGYYLRKAGECLEERNFWSTERLQFTLDWMDGEKIFFVDTDRHC